MNTEPIAPLFDRYNIKCKNGEYIVKGYGQGGQKCIMENGPERDAILSGTSLAGSIAITRTKTNRTALQILLHVAQKIHEWLTGHRGEKTLSRSCHTFIITGPSVKANGEPIPLPEKCGKGHPLMMVDAVRVGMEGVLRRSSDPLKDEGVSSYDVFVPRNGDLRKRIVKLATQTSVPKKGLGDGEDVKAWKYYHEDCIGDQDKKINFSIGKMLACLFRTGREMAPKNERAEEYTAHVLADVLQENVQNMSDPKGNKLSFFCNSYATTIFQAALFQEAVEKAGDSASFLHDENGTSLDRTALAAKIQNAFRNGGSTETEKAIQRIFQQTEFARVDAANFPSYRFVKLGKQHSIEQPVVVELPQGLLTEQPHYLE